MGCDIHSIIERHHKYRTGDGEIYWQSWENAGTPDLDRNYELFAVLAGVRNYDGIVPVADPRGLPGVTGAYEGGELAGDFDAMPCPEFQAYYRQWAANAHTPSWLTLAEIKAYDTTQEVDDGRVISDRDADGAPAALARGVYRGGRDVTAELERVGRRKVFDSPWLKDGDPTAWDRLISELERAKRDGDTDDDIRLVFFFDN